MALWPKWRRFSAAELRLQALPSDQVRGQGQCMGALGGHSDGVTAIQIARSTGE